MKILIMGGYPLGKNRSGSIIHAQKLAQSISALDGTEVHVITMGKTASQFSSGNVNIHVVAMPPIFAPFLLPFTFRSARRKIQEITPDVIHIMGDRFTYALLATPLRKNYPTLMSVFSFSERELRFSKNPIRVIRTLLISIPSMRYVIPRMSHFIVQSHFTEGIVRERSKAKIDIIPEGVDYERLRQIGTDALPDDSPDIFLAVNFRKLKGLDILIRAISIVVKSVPDVKLYIAGSGPEEKQLRSMVKELSVDSNVRFLGFISDEEKTYQYYKACKIVVVPSRWDVEPFAVLHGAAAGKPVIASKTCNSALIIDGKTGFLYDTENFEELADKIVKLLLDDNLRKGMGEAAREKAKEYDWNRIAWRTMKVYKEVMADFQKR